MHFETLEPRRLLSSYLLVSDYDTNSVLRYDAATGAFVDAFVPKHSGGLNQPQGMVFGPHDHNLYVASGEFAPSSDPHTSVLRFDGTTGAFIDEFANKGHLDGPHAVIFGPDGNLYVADGFSFPSGDPKPSKIVRYDGTTGVFIDNFVPADSGGLTGPFALVFGPSGRGHRDLDLYVVSRRTDSVKRYDGTTGAYLGDFVASGSGGLDDPIALTFGPDGNLYVSAGFGAAPSAVFRFQGPSGSAPGAPMPSAGNTGAAFVPSGSGDLLTTFGLIFGPDGNGDDEQDLYLPSFKLAGSNKADHRFSTIKRYDGVTGAFIDTFVTPNSGGLDQPNYLIFTETDPVTLAYTGATNDGTGGAIAVFIGTLTASGLTITNNQAVGGVGNTGSPFSGAGIGGGLAALWGATVTVSTSRIAGNQAIGGQGGNGFGGGLFNDGPSIAQANAGAPARLEVRGSTITDNQATGGAAGDGGSAGLGVGGGLYLALGGTVCLDAFTIDHIFGNDASTSDDDLFGDYTICE